MEESQESLGPASKERGIPPPLALHTSIFWETQRGLPSTMGLLVISALQKPRPVNQVQGDMAGRPRLLWLTDVHYLLVSQHSYDVGCQSPPPGEKMY